MAMKSFSIRMEETMLNEIRKLAKKERRSVNKQIVFLVRSYMEKHEKSLPLRGGAERSEAERCESSTIGG